MKPASKPSTPADRTPPDLDAALEPTPEQVLYAHVLEKGMYLGLGCLFVTFFIYVFDVFAPHVPLDELPQHWTKSVHQYLEDTGIEAGWSWVRMLGHGDFVNFIGITVLAGVTILCYLILVAMLLKKRDFVYAALALLEVAVLTVAASGLVAVGH